VPRDHSAPGKVLIQYTLSQYPLLPIRTYVIGPSLPTSIGQVPRAAHGPWFLASIGDKISPLLSTLYSLLFTLYSLLSTLYSLLFTLYSLLSTLYSTSSHAQCLTHCWSWHGLPSLPAQKPLNIKYTTPTHRIATPRRSTDGNCHTTPHHGTPRHDSSNK